MTPRTAGLLLVLAGLIPATGCRLVGGEHGGERAAAPREDPSRVEVSGQDESGDVVVILAAQPSAVRVGDRVHLSLELIGPAGTTLSNPPADLPPLVSIRRQSPDPGSGSQVWSWEAAAFRPGPLELPALDLTVRGPDGGEGSIHLEPLRLEVVSVLQEGDEDLADIRGPVEVPMDLSWVPAVLAGAGSSSVSR